MMSNELTDRLNGYSDNDLTQYAAYAGDDVVAYSEAPQPLEQECGAISGQDREPERPPNPIAFVGLGALTAGVLAILVSILITFTQTGDPTPGGATTPPQTSATSAPSVPQGSTQKVIVVPTAAEAPATMTNPVVTPTTTTTAEAPATMTNPVY
jgi:hypothetical protein